MQKLDLVLLVSARGLPTHHAFWTVWRLLILFRIPEVVGNRFVGISVPFIVQ
jgi:predicted membrane-bound dolichyl-phosphate-mannose-protein mannosyltransferase